MTLVFLGLPHNGTLCAQSFKGLAGATQKGVPFMFEESCSSLLARNFNELLVLCRTHDPRPTHFAMMHADICPDVGWLDVMLEEMEKFDADVISAVSPIKDSKGLTTTGRFSRDFSKLKRFTMAEIMELPETFGRPDVGYNALAVNTGLILVKTSVPWFDQMHFRMEDGIEWRDGKLIAWCRSEDWLWSEWLAANGARVFATRRVRLAHMGQRPFYNCVRHGTETSEEERLWRP